MPIDGTDYEDNPQEIFNTQLEHCGACEKVCPQHIEIDSELEKAAQLFEALYK